MIDKETLLLENNVIFLRPLHVKDITDEYINGLNSPEVNRYLVNVRINPQTKETVEKFINSNRESPSDIFFGIFIRNDPEPFIGTLRVSGIDFFHYTASIGICLFAKRAWKKGYALQSLQLVKDYLLGVVGLHYIEAGMYGENANSINLFSRAGFLEWYRVKNKFRHIDSFEETIYFAAINPLFDMSLLKK
jgi:RimJ/RimL family protein N-acetyltransferase